MMNNAVKLNLETLSPVYIGNSGNEYSCSEFVFINGGGKTKLAKININLLAEELYKTDKNKFEKFLKLLNNSQNFENVNSLKNYNSSENNYRSVLDFYKRNKNNSNTRGLHNFYSSFEKSLKQKILRNNISYKCLINHYIIYKDNDGVRKKQVLRNDIGRVKENLKTNNESYISGSSIKGAIKNAILYSELDLKNDTNNEARNSINKKNNDLKSLMKYIQITDTFNSIKEPTIYGVASIGTRRNTFSFFETIDKGNNFTLEYNNNFVEKFHLDYELKGIDISIDEIFRKLYDFSNDLIEEEIRFISDVIEPNENFFYNDVDYSKLYDFYFKLQDKNEEDSPLLRLGQGSGALTVSQLLNVKNSRSFSQFNSFRKNHILSNRQRRRFYPYDFPKTRKLVVNTLEPLGWVKLSKI